jgi:hypothetical protein
MDSSCENNDAGVTSARMLWPTLHSISNSFCLRCVDAIAHAEALGFVQESKRLFVVPKGSNDDWYWLYGTVAAGRKGVLISNDEMRDHIFGLLRPRYFSRWLTHHRHLYNIEKTHSDALLGLKILTPPAFTACVQQIPSTGAWMIPKGGDQWLCARPRSGSV